VVSHIAAFGSGLVQGERTGREEAESRFMNCLDFDEQRYLVSHNECLIEVMSQRECIASAFSPSDVLRIMQERQDSLEAERERLMEEIR
jgi:hypothetical protein